MDTRSLYEEKYGADLALGAKICEYRYGMEEDKLERRAISRFRIDH